MPYTGSNDSTLPKYVKKLSPKKRRQWIAVWTSAYEESQDESAAFAQANGVVHTRRKFIHSAGKGSTASGNYGHGGRQGKVGGSSPGIVTLAAAIPTVAAGTYSTVYNSSQRRAAASHAHRLNLAQTGSAAPYTTVRVNGRYHVIDASAAVPAPPPVSAASLPPQQYLIRSASGVSASGYEAFESLGAHPTQAAATRAVRTASGGTTAQINGQWHAFDTNTPAKDVVGVSQTHSGALRVAQRLSRSSGTEHVVQTFSNGHAIVNTKIPNGTSNTPPAPQMQSIFPQQQGPAAPSTPTGPGIVATAGNINSARAKAAKLGPGHAVARINGKYHVVNTAAQTTQAVTPAAATPVKSKKTPAASAPVQVGNDGPTLHNPYAPDSVRDLVDTMLTHAERPSHITAMVEHLNNFEKTGPGKIVADNTTLSHGFNVPRPRTDLVPGTQGRNHSDNVLSQVYAATGFDGLPHIIPKGSAQSYADNGELQMFRSVKGSHGVTGHAIQQQLIKGDYFAGKGIFGNGTYFAAANQNTPKHVAAAKSESFSYGGRQVRSTMKADARIVPIDTIHIVQAKIQSDSRLTPAARAVVANEGRLAAWLGYDAIKATTRINWTYYNVLNRTALRIEDWDYDKAHQPS